jgi:hypothetical protein
VDGHFIAISEPAREIISRSGRRKQQYPKSTLPRVVPENAEMLSDSASGN